VFLELRCGARLVLLTRFRSIRTLAI